MYQDEKIISPLEYFIAFFGASSNGETGERASWTKTSGVRFLLDSNTVFRHPLLGFIDNFAIKAAEVTNEWFFDIVMTAVYNLQPINLKSTFITIPKTEEEKQESLSRYVNQIMANSPRGWDIVEIGNDRKYKTQEGKELISSVTNKAGQVSINFFEKVDIEKVGIDTVDKRLMEILEKERNTSKPVERIESNAKAEKKNTEGKAAKNWWEFWK